VSGIRKDGQRKERDEINNGMIGIEEYCQLLLKQCKTLLNIKIMGQWQIGRAAGSGTVRDAEGRIRVNGASRYGV